ncbi:MAG: type II toxin-antitoxin system VapC family toxin [bacterium]
MEKLRDILNESEVWISRQVLREYAVIMSRPGIIEVPLSPEEIASDIEKFEDLFQVADETEEVTRILLKLIRKYGIKGKRIHDANIIATMMCNDISALLTVNIEDFEGFENIKLITV